MTSAVWWRLMGRFTSSPRQLLLANPLIPSPAWAQSPAPPGDAQPKLLPHTCSHRDISMQPPGQHRITAQSHFHIPPSNSPQEPSVALSFHTSLILESTGNGDQLWWYQPCNDSPLSSPSPPSIPERCTQQQTQQAHKVLPSLVILFYDPILQFYTIHTAWLPTGQAAAESTTLCCLPPPAPKCSSYWVFWVSPQKNKQKSYIKLILLHSIPASICITSTPMRDNHPPALPLQRILPNHGVSFCLHSHRARKKKQQPFAWN